MMMSDMDIMMRRHAESQKLQLAVDEFACKMKLILLTKLRNNWYGWDEPTNATNIMDRLDKSTKAALDALNSNKYDSARKHLTNSANLCMMLSRFCHK